jgi:DNA repair exonuclease SbcCD ATPase subunit
MGDEAMKLPLHRSESNRIQRELSQARDQLARRDDVLKGLAAQEASIRAGQRDAIVQGREHEHDEECNVIAVEIEHAQEERDRAARRVEAFESWIDDFERAQQQQAQQAIIDELAALRAQRDQQLAGLRVTEAKIVEAEQTLDELSGAEPTLSEIAWHASRAIEGVPLPPMSRKLTRAVEARIASMEAQRDEDRQRAAAATLHGPRLPDGRAAYLRIPSAADGPWAIPLDPKGV